MKKCTNVLLVFELMAYLVVLHTKHQSGDIDHLCYNTVIMLVVSPAVEAIPIEHNKYNKCAISQDIQLCFLVFVGGRLTKINEITNGHSNSVVHCSCEVKSTLPPPFLLTHNEIYKQR